MNSLNSEASILPRRMSAAFSRKVSSWVRVIFSCFIVRRLSRFRLYVSHLLFERLPDQAHYICDQQPLSWIFQKL